MASDWNVMSRPHQGACCRFPWAEQVHTAALAAKNGPTGSAYITFRRNDDARRCIESIHGMTWEGMQHRGAWAIFLAAWRITIYANASHHTLVCQLGRQFMMAAGKLVKACYGTTKYCNAFLKGLPCNNAECLYLHDVGKCCNLTAYWPSQIANLWRQEWLLRSPPSETVLDETSTGLSEAFYSQNLNLWLQRELASCLHQWAMWFIRRQLSILKASCLRLSMTKDGRQSRRRIQMCTLAGLDTFLAILIVRLGCSYRGGQLH